MSIWAFCIDRLIVAKQRNDITYSKELHQQNYQLQHLWYYHTLLANTSPKTKYK